jgi:hypothetical protein
VNEKERSKNAENVEKRDITKKRMRTDGLIAFSATARISKETRKFAGRCSFHKIKIYTSEKEQAKHVNTRKTLHACNNATR